MQSKFKTDDTDPRHLLIYPHFCKMPPNQWKSEGLTNYHTFDFIF